MNIVRFSLGQLQANCYFIIKDNDCLVVDPADDASFILEELSRRNLKLSAMLATHGHFDHIMAAGEVQLSLKVPLYINNKDQFLIERLEDTARHFLGYEPQIIKPAIIEHIIEGELKIGSFRLEIVLTPGHTPGSVCLYLSDEKRIFTGDTLFKQGVGRYDFSYGNKKDLDQSLKKLFMLPEDVIVYSGHGERTTLGNEKSI